MGKSFNPEKYNMAFYPLCKEKGKLPKNPDGFDSSTLLPQYACATIDFKEVKHGNSWRNGKGSLRESPRGR